MRAEEVMVDRRPEHPEDLSPGLPDGSQQTEIGEEGEIADLEAADALGAVRIAPRVLRTVVEEAALRVPGVARMAPLSGNLSQLLGRALPHHGVGLSVHGHTVNIDLYLVVQPSASMLEVGAAVQEAVSVAVEHILGMHARQINVYIQDVA
jgi:uncharacterized alkaline shock family protein YloU